jgi:hypothetical protein
VPTGRSLSLRSWPAWLVAAALGLGLGGAAGCGDDRAALDGDGGLISCWLFTCPDDRSATTCGTCVHAGVDVECTPGFVCSCDRICVRGPRSFDAQPGCVPDAQAPGTPDAGTPLPDARIYDWPACDDHHLPGQPI